jgi:hypothetical protein
VVNLTIINIVFSIFSIGILIFTPESLDQSLKFGISSLAPLLASISSLYVIGRASLDDVIFSNRFNKAIDEILKKKIDLIDHIYQIEKNNAQLVVVSQLEISESKKFD